MMSKLVPISFLLFTAYFCSTSAYADSIGPDLSAIPQPAASVPPPEVVGGSIGAASTYRRGDAVQPRITRSNTVTIDAAGSATFDWTTQGALATPVQVIISPVNTSSTAIPICYATAVSATAASIKCTMVNTANITLALVTAGLNLFGASASGMQVGIVALPKS
jgi:hypothetical protein